MDVSPQLLKRPWSVSSTPSTPGRQLQLDAAEAFLFETPSDLLCPITQAPFSDPVLTSSGHVSDAGPVWAASWAATPACWQTQGLASGQGVRHTRRRTPVPAIFAEVMNNHVQVYERAAIERYLRENNSDPLSRQPLVNK